MAIQQESSRDWWGHRSSIDLEVEILVGPGLAERSGLAAVVSGQLGLSEEGREPSDHVRVIARQACDSDPR